MSRDKLTHRDADYREEKQIETKRYREHTCVLCVRVNNEKSVSACERGLCEIGVTLTQRVIVNWS